MWINIQSMIMESYSFCHSFLKKVRSHLNLSTVYSSPHLRSWAGKFVIPVTTRRRHADYYWSDGERNQNRKIILLRVWIEIFPLLLLDTGTGDTGNLIES